MRPSSIMVVMVETVSPKVLLVKMAREASPRAKWMEPGGVQGRTAKVDWMARMAMEEEAAVVLIWPPTMRTAESLPEPGEEEAEPEDVEVGPAREAAAVGVASVSLLWIPTFWSLILPSFLGREAGEAMAAPVEKADKAVGEGILPRAMIVGRGSFSTVFREAAAGEETERGEVMVAMEGEEPAALPTGPIA